MREGWKCPGCGACLSPDVKECLSCGGTAKSHTGSGPIADVQCERCGATGHQSAACPRVPLADKTHA